MTNRAISTPKSAPGADDALCSPPEDPERRARLTTLSVNWLVKRFSMAFIAWLFFRYAFSAWISPADAH